MRFVTYRSGNGGSLPGLLQDDWIVPLDHVAGSLLELIGKGEAAIEQVKVMPSAPQARAVPLTSVTLLAPIPKPAKNIVCVGRNYQEHVDEGDRAAGQRVGAPPVPIFFTKPATAVVGPDAAVVLHPQTSNLDYEVELGVVIGRTCRNVPEAEALDTVWGYTVINDITARDLQDRHGQWFKGKSLDTFCPIGPVLVHRSAVPDPHVLDIELHVNGERRQRDNTRRMIFNINRIIAELSAGLTLEPGDIIATGTTSGCAWGMSPPAWLQPGDVVEARVEGIGVLRNTIARP